MDRNFVLSSSQETKKAARKRKSSRKTTPLKVVYISNPMRVQTSASEFRALVQELTGQDAEFPDPSKFPAVVDAGVDVADHETDLNQAKKLVVDVPSMEDSDDLKSQYESLDDIFTTQMMENLGGVWPQALLHEPNLQV